MERRYLGASVRAFVCERSVRQGCYGELVELESSLGCASTSAHFLVAGKHHRGETTEHACLFTFCANTPSIFFPASVPAAGHVSGAGVVGFNQDKGLALSQLKKRRKLN